MSMSKFPRGAVYGAVLQMSAECPDENQLCDNVTPGDTGDTGDTTHSPDTGHH